MVVQAETNKNDNGSKSGKFLTFALGDEAFGLEILKVREIIGMMDITSVPLTPPFIKGIINLRGRVIPVMDLRTKFGMPQADRTSATCIIVVFFGHVEIGVIVDEVSEVVDIVASDIDETPSLGAGIDTRFIMGIGKTSPKVTILLDIDKTLSNQDVQSLSSVAA